MRTAGFRQRGMAVIAAMLVVIAASVLAMALIEGQGRLVRVLSTERHLAQAHWLLRGGLDWSRVILHLDARENATTRLDGLWTQTLADLPVGPADNPRAALFSGRIEDAQGKFNLRDLAADGRASPAAVASLERLLQWLGRDPALAGALAQRIADSQPGPGRAPVAMGLRSLDDLQGIEGLGLPGVEALRPYAVYLPETVPLNANTAPAEVLGAVIEGLGLAGARDLTAQRDRGLWFVNRGDLVNRLPALQASRMRRLDVRSDWFSVAGEVSVGDTMVGLRALLQRDRQGRASVRWVSYG
ncbi:MAG: type II secretion system minor pseudopilin GspK [Castellaniella sp.]|uniref:type II secretion system minor pseudopilin GspK n=1 Tax=Castellaniella sp. TaxID=1955812 RepID=UPI003C71F687